MKEDQHPHDSLQRQSEERLRLAMACGDLATWDWDVASGRVIWSDKHYLMLGYKIGEVEANYQAWLDRVHPDDRLAAEVELARARDSRSIYRLNFRAVLPGENIRWLSVQGQFFYDDGGAPVRMIGVSRDITSERNSETSLRQSEERQAFLLKLSDALRPFADAAQIRREALRVLGGYFGVTGAQFHEFEENGEGIVCTKGEPNRVLPLTLRAWTGDCGPALKDTLHSGRTLTLADVSTHAKFPAHDAPGIRAFVSVPVIREGKLLAALELHQRSPRAWSEAESTLAEESADRLWVAVDRARTEEALRESEARFRSLLKASNEVIYHHNADWSEMVQLRGGGFLADTERPDPEWFSRYIPKDDQPHVWAAIQEAIRTKSVFQLEHRVVQADGSIGWVLSRSTPLIGKDGEVHGWFGAASDVTARREAEEALRESEERLRKALQEAEGARERAVAATEAKDRFLAILSHELRTPLTPVLLAAEALADNKELSGATLNSVKMIERNVKLEARLVDDLLDVTRISRGKLEIDPQLLDLHETIRTAVEISHVDLEAKNQKMILKLEAGGHQVMGDPTRLQQVFWNLLKNASKFSTQGSSIEIVSRNEPGHIIVEVRDDGIGFEPEATERIFAPFEQASRMVTRRYGGLGLGLAISKATLEAHQGTIRATSAGSEKGATFTVELPLAR